MTESTCTVDGCTKTVSVKSRGLCGMHYARLIRSGEIGAADKMKVRQTGPCTVDGCDTHAKVKGLCNKHYQRQRRHGTTDDSVGHASRAKFCTVEGCDRRHNANGYCAKHDYRAKAGIPLNAPPLKTPRVGTCRGPQCDAPILAKSLCATHYAQQAAGEELTPKRVYEPKGGPCAAGGCDREAKVVGMCQTHRRYWLRGDEDWQRPIPEKAPDGAGSIDPHGYRVITVHGKQWREHRYNAEQELGRPLRFNEDVHHVNTNRLDNHTDGAFTLDARGRMRSGNLEIWAHSHPRGAEIGPRMEWFVDELALYADVLPASVLEKLLRIAARAAHE